MFQILPVTPDIRQAFDVMATDAKWAITAEFKRDGTSFSSDWWVSGLTPTGGLSILVRLSFPTAQLDGLPDRPQVLQNLYETWVRPLAESAVKHGGLPRVPLPPEVEFKKLLCEAHLLLHQKIGNIGPNDLPPKLNVARQYELIKSIGYKAAIPMIAEREGLKPSTVIRRLDTAKAEGLLPKSIQPEHLREK